MKYALAQMGIAAGDPKKNREYVENWLADTMRQHQPDAVVLPEMWTSAYTLPSLEDVADREGEPTVSFLQTQAKQHNVHIIGGSVANKKHNRFYNTALVVNRNGRLVHQYDKIHLVPMLDEPAYLTGGAEKAKMFTLDGVKMGLLICYDLRFPELARKFALEGVAVLYVVAEWPLARRDHWRTLLLARAIENQMVIVACNRIGAYDGTTFAGTSLVADPWGKVVTEAGENEVQTVVAEINLAQVPEVRRQVPVFTSRVPELY